MAQAAALSAVSQRAAGSSQMVIATFPRTWPCSAYSWAAASSSRGNSLQGHGGSAACILPGCLGRAVCVLDDKPHRVARQQMARARLGSHRLHASLGVCKLGPSATDTCVQDHLDSADSKKCTERSEHGYKPKCTRVLTCPGPLSLCPPPSGRQSVPVPGWLCSLA